MAVTAGWRHHGSRRSVLSGICALALAGACVTCVIDASALQLKLIVQCHRTGSSPRRAACPPRAAGGAALPALRTEPYSNGNSHVDLGVTSGGVTLATRAPSCSESSLPAAAQHRSAG